MSSPQPLRRSGRKRKSTELYLKEVKGERAEEEEEEEEADIDENENKSRKRTRKQSTLRNTGKRTRRIHHTNSEDAGDEIAEAIEAESTTRKTKESKSVPEEVRNEEAFAASDEDDETHKPPRKRKQRSNQTRTSKSLKPNEPTEEEAGEDANSNANALVLPEMASHDKHLTSASAATEKLREDIASKFLPELRSMCREAKLRVSGTKNALVERLVQNLRRKAPAHPFLLNSEYLRLFFSFLTPLEMAKVSRTNKSWQTVAAPMVAHLVRLYQIGQICQSCQVTKLDVEGVNGEEGGGGGGGENVTFESECDVCTKRICKRDAMEIYGLTKNEVEELQCVEKVNPRYPSSASMKLFVIGDLMLRAVKKYGSIHGLELSRKKKETRKELKEKKEKAKSEWYESVVSEARAQLADMSAEERRILVDAELKAVGTERRDDSKLCNGFINGSVVMPVKQVAAIIKGVQFLHSFSRVAYRKLHETLKNKIIANMFNHRDAPNYTWIYAGSEAEDTVKKAASHYQGYDSDDYGGGRACYNCGQYGHFARHCYW